MLILMGIVAAIGIYSVFTLRHSAEDATRIGGQLNAVALEIHGGHLDLTGRAERGR